MKTPIITIKEARKILGKSSTKMTDDQVEELIISLDEMARLYFKGIREGTIKLPVDKPN